MQEVALLEDSCVDASVVLQDCDFVGGGAQFAQATEDDGELERSVMLRGVSVGP